MDTLAGARQFFTDSFGQPFHKRCAVVEGAAQEML